MIEAAGQVFEAYRGELCALAYRMTGSRAEAEDLVQEGFVRLHRAAVMPDNPRAWLYRVVTRLCLDHLKSARARREVYRGPWLPEPMVEPAGSLADALVERADEVTVALLLALETLSPAARAAFVLRAAFDVEYAELAETLGRSEAACRQLVSRARATVQAARPVERARSAEVERVVAAFFEAVGSGDVEALAGVLAEDVVLVTDGGGEVLAVGKPIVGAARVARVFGAIARKYPLPASAVVRPARINGLPGVVVMEGGRCVQTLAVEVRGGKVVRVLGVRSPSKLARVG
ncbi:MAG: RNA polymerase sigma factor SigJ [bacterium]